MRETVDTASGIEVMEKQTVIFPKKNRQCAEQLLTEPSEYQKLLSPFFKPISEELLDWQNSPFTQSKEYPEQLKIEACSGNLVRSKSEALIDMFLFKNKIPFRYECELKR